VQRHRSDNVATRSSSARVADFVCAIAARRNRATGDDVQFASFPSDRLAAEYPFAGRTFFGTVIFARRFLSLE